MKKELIDPADYPMITVVTPTLNQGGYIDQTISSVLDQDYPWLEYIVVDGGSTDNTLEILNHYSDKLTWISEKDRGQSNAINKGLRMAGGDVLAYLNSDDVYQPGALLKAGEFFASQPEAAWLTGRCRIIDQEGAEIRRGVTLYKNFWLRINSYRALCVLDFISQPATFWRREVMDVIGEFNENLAYAMDYDFSLRVGKKFKLWVLNEYLASFRVHPSSKAGSSAHAQFEVDYQIAQRYSASKLLQSLHKIHNSIIVGTYRTLLWNSQQETMTEPDI